MSSSDGFPPTGVQTRVLNSIIDTSLLEILLFGIYTTIYAITMYIYLTSRKSRSILVLSSITILYLVNIGEIAVTWIGIRQFVEFAGRTREDIYISLNSTPGWVILTSDIFTFMLSAVADALLIWRCYHAWDGSFRVIGLPVFLVIAESACYIAVIICAAVNHLHPSQATAVIMNDLLGASMCTSLASTLITTSLIIYRIRSVAVLHAGSRIPIKNQRHFTNILDLLVQSAAAYVIVLLVNAILTIITLDPESTLDVTVGQDFVNCIFPIITGLAPTVMAARVAIASSKPATDQSRTKISDLNFNEVAATDNMSFMANIGSYAVADNITLQIHQQV